MQAARWVETTDLPLSDLTPFPGNARRGNVELIRESVRRNGQYRSLVVRVVDGAYVVLAGNCTMQALAAEKLKTARCDLIECDDATARRINLADNRLSDLATYDRPALTELLAALDGDLTGTGYTEKDAKQAALQPEDAELLVAWGVIITCRDETHQVALLRQLTSEGRRVRALIA